MIESIEHGGRLLAIVVSHRYEKPGVTFFTPGEFSQQLAFIQHAAGHFIEAHVHNRVGETCPECGDVVRAVEYSHYTVAYCASCQTDGKVLADNTTSKFLK